MAVPKRRTSKMKKRLRRSGQRKPIGKINICSECGNPVPSHVACPGCGMYHGRQILTIDDL